MAGLDVQYGDAALDVGPGIAARFRLVERLERIALAVEPDKSVGEQFLNPKVRRVLEGFQYL